MPRSRGQSTISLALYTGIALAAIGIIVTGGTPVLENIRDANAIDTAQEILPSLQQQMQRVARGGQGAEVETTIRFSRGTYRFDAADDEIIYEIETRSQVVSPGTSQQIGDIRISAMADVDLTPAAVEGQDCWRMENDHVAVCIRDVPEDAQDAAGTDTVGYWRFSEGDGSTVGDASDYGNDLSVGGADWTAGVAGSGLAFDGTDTATGTVPEASGGEFAVALWMNPSSVSGEDAAVGLGAGDDATVYLDDATGQVRFNVSGVAGGPYSGAIGSYATGTWQHVVLSYNGTHVTGYLDGVRGAAVPASGNFAPADDTVDVGADGDGADNFVGKLDEVRVWNASVTGAEAAWLHERGGDPTHIDTRDLILEYHNKDTGEDLNASFGISLETGQQRDLTRYGSGSVEPDLVGAGLGSGTIEAQVRSEFGIDYRVIFTMYSRSDFLQVDVRTS